MIKLTLLAAAAALGLTGFSANAEAAAHPHKYEREHHRDKHKKYKRSKTHYDLRVSVRPKYDRRYRNYYSNRGYYGPVWRDRYGYYRCRTEYGNSGFLIVKRYRSVVRHQSSLINRRNLDCVDRPY